jgi:hypothetical protein
MHITKLLFVTFGIMAGVSTGLQAQFNYTINADLTVTITGYTGPGGAVTIPPMINSLLVTSIGGSAFLGSSLTSITIPSGVTSIGAGAFWNCGSLTSITIPSGVTTIVDGTFYQCVSLTNITIPSSVTTIGSSAFYDCTSLAIVSIPNSVTTIGDSAFAGCTNLAGVYFHGNTPSLGGTNVFSGADYSILYYLPGTVGWGTTFAGRPALPCNPQVLDSSVGVRANQFGFTFTGSYGMLIVVEACTSLDNPVWVPMQTNTLGVGTVYFNDPNSTHYVRRFYRLRSP